MSYLPQGTSPSLTRSNNLADVVPLGASASESSSSKGFSEKAGGKKSFEDSIQAALSHSNDSGTAVNSTRARTEQPASGRSGMAAASSSGATTRESKFEGRRGTLVQSRPGPSAGSMEAAMTAGNDSSVAGDANWNTATLAGEGNGREGLESSGEDLSAEEGGTTEPGGNTAGATSHSNGDAALQWMAWAAMSQHVAPPPPMSPDAGATSGAGAVGEECEGVAGVQSQAVTGHSGSSSMSNTGREEGAQSLEGSLKPGRDEVLAGAEGFHWAPSARWSAQVWERMGLEGMDGGTAALRTGADGKAAGAVEALADTGTKLPGVMDEAEGGAEIAGQTSTLPVQGADVLAQSRMRFELQGWTQARKGLEGLSVADTQPQGLVEGGMALGTETRAQGEEAALGTAAAEAVEASGTSGAQHVGIMRSVVSKRGESPRNVGATNHVNASSEAGEGRVTTEALSGITETDLAATNDAASRERDGQRSGDESGVRDLAAIQGMMGSGAAVRAQETSEGADLPAISEARNPAVEAALLSGVTPKLMELKQQTPNLMTLVLRPDQQTELFVELRHRDGQVEIQVRMDRGDASAVKASWEHLKNAFSSQGITLHPLMEGGSADGLAQGLSANVGMLNRQVEAMTGSRPNAASLEGMGLAAALDPRGSISATLGSSSTGSGSDEQSSFRRDQGSDPRQQGGSDAGFAQDMSGGRGQRQGGREGQSSGTNSDSVLWAEQLRRGGRGGVVSGGVAPANAGGKSVKSDAWDAWA